MTNPQQQLAERVAEALYAGDRASQSHGIRIVEVRPGYAKLAMIVRSDMVNGHRICHGGMIFSLADTAFACACNSWGPVSVAAECDIIFVAPARGGDVLTAEASVRSRYGRNGIYDVTVRLDGGVIAEFRGRSSEVRLPYG